MAQIGLHIPLQLHECVPSGQWQVSVHGVPAGHTACGAGLSEVGGGIQGQPISLCHISLKAAKSTYACVLKHCPPVPCN